MLTNQIYFFQQHKNKKKQTQKAEIDKVISALGRTTKSVSLNFSSLFFKTNLNGKGTVRVRQQCRHTRTSSLQIKISQFFF